MGQRARRQELPDSPIRSSQETSTALAFLRVGLVPSKPTCPHGRRLTRASWRPLHAFIAPQITLPPASLSLATSACKRPMSAKPSSLSTGGPLGVRRRLAGQRAEGQGPCRSWGASKRPAEQLGDSAEPPCGLTGGRPGGPQSGYVIAGAAVRVGRGAASTAGRPERHMRNRGSINFNDP